MAKFSHNLFKGSAILFSVISLIFGSSGFVKLFAQCGTPSQIISQSGCPGTYTLEVRSLNTSVTSVKWYTSSSGSDYINPTTNGSVNGVWISTYTANFSTSVTYWVALVCPSGETYPRTAVSFTSTATTVTLESSSDPMAVVPGSSFSLTASGPGNRQWRWGNASSGIISTNTSINPTKGGMYYLYATNNCSAVYNLSQQVNFVPAADAGLDLTFALPASSCSIYGSGADQDGDAITFSWTQLSGPAATMSGAASSTLSLSGLAAATYSFRLTVTDVYGKSSYDDVSVNVVSISNNYNYVLKENVKIPGQLTNSAVSALPVESKSVGYSYSDGMGKTRETIGWKASPTQTDIISANEYDDLQRGSKSYLPIQNSQNTGNFISNILGSTPAAYVGSAHYNFYNPGGTGIPTDTKPYKTAFFEASPLGRVTSEGSLGANFQPGENDRDLTYGTNVASDVRIWDITGALPTSSSTWEANLLTVTTSTAVTTSDGQTTQSQVISNRQGLKLLERSKIDATEWAETYYVYDSRNNLRFILPPELMKTIKTGGFRNPTQTEVDAWVFQYLYDDEGRAIESKSPGAGWAYAVYDKRDRIVLSQNANQRAVNEWSYTKYDELDRPLISGIYRPGSAISRATMQSTINALNGGLGYGNIIPRVESGVKVGVDIIISAYESINEYKAVNAIVIKPGFTFMAGSTATSFKASIDNGSGGVAADVYPNTNDEDLVITYYDSYANCAVCQESSYQFVAETFTVTSNEPFQRFDRLKGKTVAGSVKTINTGKWRHSVNYFNRLGNTIQAIATNHRGGVVKTSSLFDFSGKLLQSISWLDGIKISERFDYDHTGRILKAYHQMNQQPEVVLSASEFNSLGEPIGKNIHSVDGSQYLQYLDFRSDIRGWTTRVNNTNITGNKDADDPVEDYFGMEYGYQNSFTGNPGRYDGFYKDVKWKDDLGKKERLYNFGYDNLGRLLNADYNIKDNGIASPSWTVPLTHYAENQQYDRSGNIISLNRFGKKQSDGSFQLDQLAYTYNSGNQLSKVADGRSVTEGFKDGNISGDDYSYDANGNLLEDKNKAISSIEYNHMNLVEKVNFTNGSYIDNVYDASGIRLSVTYYNNSVQPPVTIKTEHVNGFVYVNDVLLHIGHGEGRVVPTSYTNLIPNSTRDANVLDGFTSNGSVTLTTEYSNGETYVKAVCNQGSGTPGVFQIGNTITVKKDETYSFKVLGYQSVGSTASLYVQANTGDLIWPGTALPVGSANENYVTNTFTIPAGVTTIKVGVLWNGPAVGNTIYINRVSLYKTDFEYQYFLTDQQGSPRVVLQTTPATVIYNATMESENFSIEKKQFIKLSEHPNDITPAYYEINSLGGTAPVGNEAYRMTMLNRVGPAKSFQVFPGDIVNASVKAYAPVTSGFSPATVPAMILALQNVMLGGVVVDGAINTAYTNPNSNPLLALSPSQGSGQVKAFLNYILFDENYEPLEAKSYPVQNTTSVHTVPMDQLTIKQLGYLFIYLSYDNENTIPVYFDDFKITYNESPVIQVNAYYPFGLSAYSWIREGETENKYLYQGKELDSKTGWQDFGSRQYAADLGRWLGVDPQGNKMSYNSLYAAMMNNPTAFNDPDGECPICIPMFIGMAMGMVQDHMSGNTSMTGMFKGGLMGALGGFAGILAPAGILPGMAYGAGTGAALGATNAALNGTSISKGATMGALTGGIAGGISGGISAFKNGSNLWTGQSSKINALYASEVPDLQGQTKSITYDDKSLRAFSKKQFGKQPGVIGLTKELPQGYWLDDRGLIGGRGEFDDVLGFTRPTIWGGNRITTIHISKAAFADDKLLFLTLGHEYVHASHFYYGLFRNFADGINSGGFDALTESAAYGWEIKTIAANGWAADHGAKYMFNIFNQGVINTPSWLVHEQRFLSVMGMDTNLKWIMKP